MAVSLINAVANIPEDANSSDGDIIRFSTTITSNIPSKVKKADGTTTEDDIKAGYEYRRITSGSSVLWMKIGGDPLQITPLKDVLTLASGDFENAIIGAVHNSANSGRIRKLGLSLLHRALQSVNPLELSITTEIIFAQDIASAGTYNLSIKTGSERYKFSDYQFLIFECGWDQTEPLFPSAIPTEAFENRYTSTKSARIRAEGSGTVEFYRVSDTSFYSTITGDFSIQRILGVKVGVALETP